MEKKRLASFSGTLGFVLASAASAVGIGNIWRFPYLAAKDGGGLFLFVYIALVITFGFSLLITDIAIGRKTRSNPIHAFASLRKKFKFVGILTFMVPSIIITYYTVLGGWITKYLAVYVSGQGATASNGDYFSNFISSPVSSIVFMLIFLAITALIVFLGVEKGIERFSKWVMPGLIVIILGIALYSLTLSYTDANGETRTGLQGLAVYVIPNFEGLTFSRFMEVLLDAMSQLFFSLSVSMGIMITYGAYVKDEVNLSKSVTHIEIFDTGVAFLSGLLILPSVYVFLGAEGMQSQGAGLMFVSLPKVFDAMGGAGAIVGALFFIMVEIAALTSSVSVLETVVASVMEMTGKSRKFISFLVAAVAAAGAVFVCLGYSVFYFEVIVPGASKPGQLLDVLDYISNSLMMPFISLMTCILVGWVIKPKSMTDEIEKSGHKFHRKKLYVVMIKFIAPVLMLLLLCQSSGLISILTK